MARERHGQRSRKQATPPEYRAWLDMRYRCRNPDAQRYDRYGGRGIRVCARWESYTAFLADIGPRPSPSHSLDRIDNDGDYEPGNVRWATRSQQARNTQARQPITWRGQTRLIVEWAERTSIPAHRIYWRIYRQGWTVERALTEPVAPRRRQARVRWPKGATKPQPWR